ncbi:selenium cofactor biosynthesis protein YqeC [Oscillospiraceae bacterium PP1C4]
MRLIEKLMLEPAREHVISIVGSGGKTTLLYALAREAAYTGLHTAIITTTHIMQPPSKDDLRCVYDGSTAQIEQALADGKIIVAGTQAPNGKLMAPDTDTLHFLLQAADILLIEADGSRRLPIKLPSSTEPVILPKTRRVIAVAGLSALGKPLGEVCHRAELVQAQLGFTPEQTVTPKIMAALLLQGYGTFAGLTVLLNQADTPALAEQGEQIASLLREGGIEHILITSLLQEADSLC